MNALVIGCGRVGSNIALQLDREGWDVDGIYAFSKTIMVGESQDPRLMAPREAVEVAEANRDVIVGIKVRVGRHASGDQTRSCA